VAAVQGVILALVTADLLPTYAAVAVLGLALGSLTWSFGLDTYWLYRANRVREAARSRWSPSRGVTALAGHSAA
jgi:hypothetical protein